MAHIIALTGPAGSGKDLTASKMISQLEWRHPKAVIKTLSFAAPIKAAVAAILGCSVSYLEHRDFKETSLAESHDLEMSPRQLMQILGTEWGRQLIDPQIWIKTAQHRFESFEQAAVPADYVFITDLRFDNEHEWVKSHGGTVILIDRPSAAPVAGHASEAGLALPPTYTINNHGSLDALCRACLDVVERIDTMGAPHNRRLSDTSPAEWDRLRP